MDDEMKVLFNKIKTEKKIDKIKQLEIELPKIKYGSNPNKLKYELEELNKIHVNGKT